MEMVPVTSTNVKAVGYHDGTLVVAFHKDKRGKGGGLYHYFAVPPTVYHELLKSPSKGSFIHQMVKGKYAHRKIE